ncbi:MAG TPA: hypothetical protein VJ870_14395 [Amycolatopsis sp.]|nr:hypothetical protein [Amycolatopsis sp.]
MTQHAYPHSGTAGAREMPQSQTGPTTSEAGWSGKLAFGGVVMIVAGLFNVIIGLVAVINRDYYVVRPSGLLVLNLTGWGWLHLILGALIALTGAVLFSGATWARVVTVVLAGFNALASLAFLSVYPFWSIVVIALDIVVIWAVLTADAETDADA